MFAGWLGVVRQELQVGLSDPYPVSNNQGASSYNAKTVAERTVDASHVYQKIGIAFPTNLGVQTRGERVGYTNIIARRPSDGNLGLVDFECVLVALLSYNQFRHSRNQ